MKERKRGKERRTSGSLTRSPFLTIGVTERNWDDKGLIKKMLRIVIWRVGTYEEGCRSDTYSPHSEHWRPGLSELCRMKEKKK